MRRSFALSLALVLTSACKSAEIVPDDTRKNRRFELVYAATVDEVPAGAKEVRVWLPLAATTLDQKVEDVKVICDWPYEIHELEGGAGQFVCATSPGQPFRLETHAVVTRYETTGGGKASQAELADALGADAMIPLDGRVAAIAAGMQVSPDRRLAAKALYEHTLERMRYDKPEGQPWGRGDAEWACDARFGNCTDFHSYFMGLARTKGIPARFEMGFSVPTGTDAVLPIKGYHCWAFFWQDGAGWVPVDISEADKAPEKSEYFFGTLDEHRVTLSGGRDVTLTPRPKKGALNFFVYPYAEVDGVELTKIARTVEARPLAPSAAEPSAAR